MRGGRGWGERGAQDAERSEFATVSPSLPVSHYTRCRCLPPSAPKLRLRRRANSADMTTVVFSIQHAGAAKLEEIVVEVHPEWAPIGAQCVRPARTT